MHGATFPQRYLNGEYLAVCDELIATDGVRDPLYLEDAAAVATETMKRVRHNVEVLIPRLAEMGYRFVLVFWQEHSLTVVARNLRDTCTCEPRASASDLAVCRRTSENK